MVIALVAVFFRRKSAKLPRYPATLATTLSYICASHMLDDLKDFRTMQGSQRDEAIMKSGDRFFLGVSTGTDGVKRVMVDRESGLVS